MRFRIFSSVLLVALALAGVAGSGRAASEEDEPLGAKIKRLFATPTPTPRKKKSTVQKSPTPKPRTSPQPSPSAKPAADEKPAAKDKAAPEPEETPVKHHKESPEPEATKSASGKKRKKALPDETPTPLAQGKTKDEESPSPSPEKLPAGNGNHAPVATISSDEILGYEKYPPEIKKLLDLALNLTTRNLGYKYGSNDPANGGMDCSGFVHYVLSQQGLKDVPRDSREQYIWVRQAGTFEAVVGRTDDGFELDALKPGDLLFWTGTYQVERDPNITHTMIYVGREKGSNQRIMVGSSDGRTYKGQSRFGVSIFDFNVARASRKANDDAPGPSFVGYGRIPGLPH